MEIIDWNDAMVMLDEVNSEFCGFLGALYETGFHDGEKADIRVARADYKYGEKFARNMTVYWPNEKPVSGDFLTKYGFPFGIVLHGSLEILERSFSSSIGAFDTQAVLRRSEFVGAFELLDYICSNKNAPPIDWVINAGVSNLFHDYNFDTQAATKIARRQIGPISDADAFRKNKNLVERMRCVPDAIKAVEESGWRTTVLFFNKTLIDAIVKRIKNSVHRENELNFMFSVFGASWKNISVFRYGSDYSYKFFSTNVNTDGFSQDRSYSNADILLNERSYAFASFINDTLIGRRALFVPDSEDSELLPAKTIFDNFLCFFSDTPLLRPDFCSDSTPKGYIPLDVIPHFRAGLKSSETFIQSLRDVLSKVKNATLNASRSGDNENCFITNFYQSVPALTFRVPAEKTQGNYRVFKLTPSSNSVINTEEIEIDEGYFFQFFGKIPKNSRSPFFRSCILIDKNLRET